MELQGEPQREPQEVEPRDRPPLASHAGQQLMEVTKVSPKTMKPKALRPGPKNRGSKSIGPVMPTVGPKHRGSKSTSPVMPTGPKPKAPKMSTGRKSESPSKAEEHEKNKTPIEIKKEKLDEQVDEETTSAAPKKDSEKSAVPARIQGRNSIARLKFQLTFSIKFF